MVLDNRIGENNVLLDGAPSHDTTSQATQQGRRGLILKARILTAPPPMAAMFLQGTLVGFMPYSQIGGRTAGQPSARRVSRRGRIRRRSLREQKLKPVTWKRIRWSELHRRRATLLDPGTPLIISVRRGITDSWLRAKH